MDATIEYSEAGKPRRLMMYRVSPDVLMMLGQTAGGARVSVQGPSLPADAKPVNVAYDYMRNSFAITVESAEFPLTRPGMEIPSLADQWFVIQTPPPDQRESQSWRDKPPLA